MAVLQTQCSTTYKQCSSRSVCDPKELLQHSSFGAVNAFLNNAALNSNSFLQRAKSKIDNMTKLNGENPEIENRVKAKHAK